MDLKKAVKPNPDAKKCPDCGKPLVWKKFKMWYKDDAGNDVWMDLPCLDCDCRKIKEIKNSIASGVRMGAIPKEYIHEDLSDWKTVKGTEDLHSAAMTYVADLRNNIKRGIGAIFIGAGYGTGKTKHAYYIQIEAIKLGIPTFTVTSTKLMSRIRAYKECRQYAAAADLIRRCIQVPLLIYDDLGKTKPHHWDKADVESIIIDREVYGRSTIFTSNTDEDKLDEHFGEHITSRVMKMSVPYIAVVDSKIDMRRPENRKEYGLAIRQ